MCQDSLRNIILHAWFIFEETPDVKAAISREKQIKGWLRVSDVDVLVSFDESAGWDLFDVVNMIDELKGIFGRNVDFVEKGTIRNPFRRHSIMTTREVLHAA